jgi:hypothetical protein
MQYLGTCFTGSRFTLVAGSALRLRLVRGPGNMRRA